MSGFSSNENSGVSQHPMLDTIYSSPLTAAVISKLVAQPSNIASSGIRDTKMGAEASQGELNRASSGVQQEIKDGKNSLELFPDIELSKQTLISSILAPNNMCQEDLNFHLEHPNIPPDIANQIIEIIRPEIEGYYGLKESLFTILEDALFLKGSHMRLVLPESAVDHLINDRPSLRVESVGDVNKIFNDLESGSIGFLGNPKGNNVLKFESSSSSPLGIKHPLDEDGQILSNLITVGDNFGALKKPGYQQLMTSSAIRGKIKALQKRGADIKTESIRKYKTETFNTRETIKDVDLKSAIYKAPPAGSDLFLRVPDRDNLSRHSLGRPMYTVVPSEAVIPVHFPGQPEKAIGAFLLADQDGYFLTLESQRKFSMSAQNHLNQISSNTSGGNSNTTVNSSLLEKAKSNLRTGDGSIPLTYLAEIFGNILEEDLLKRIKNGIYGTEAAISRNNDIYSVMLARTLAGAQTQIVYVPKEFFTYFAFQYNANGTGRSLLADVKNLISLRAVSLYAKVANQIRNAISITDVKVELDPRDPSPQRTMEKIVDLTSQTRTQYFPWGLNTPTDIANWWHRAGFQLNVTGHPSLPTTTVSYEQRHHDKNTPSIDEDDSLNDMIHMHFGITKEMRDAGLGAQFATSIVNNNILFSKRVMQLQNPFNLKLSDHVRVIVNNDGFISTKIRRKVTEEWGKIATGFDGTLKTLAEQDKDKAIDFFLDEVIDALRVSLPQPETTTIKNQMESFTEFKEALEATFDFIISDDAVSQSVLGESAEKIVALKEPLKAQLIRDWMRTNNFMTNLFDLVEVDEDGKPKSQATIMAQEHLKRLSSNIIGLMGSFTPVSVAIAKDLADLAGGEEVPEDTVDSEGDGSEDADPGEEDSGDTPGDSGEFNMNDDPTE